MELLTHNVMPLEPASDIRFLTFPERFVEVFLGCSGHVWGWPFSTNTNYPAPFDSHQVCCKCSKTRFYRSKVMQAGPMFRETLNRGGV